MKKRLVPFIALLFSVLITGFSVAASYTLPEKMYNQIAIGSGMKGSFQITKEGNDFDSPLLNEITDAEFSVRGIFSGEDFHFYTFQTDESDAQFALSAAARSSSVGGTTWSQNPRTAMEPSGLCRLATSSAIPWAGFGAMPPCSPLWRS